VAIERMGREVALMLFEVESVEKGTSMRLSAG
jgi:hypothetical protein